MARAYSGPALTTVSDVVYRADGATATGTLVISWNAFTTADGKAIPAGEMSVSLAPTGAINLALAPNEGATPDGSYYKVVYKLNDGTTSTEYWTVPAAGPVNIAAVRASVIPRQVALQFGGKPVVQNPASAQTIAGAYDLVLGGGLVPVGSGQPLGRSGAAWTLTSQGINDSGTINANVLTSSSGALNGSIGSTTPAAGTFTSVNNIRFAANAADIQTQIDAAYASGGGDVWLKPSAAYAVSSQIKLKNGVHLRCWGGSDYNDSTHRPCTIKPAAGFSGTSVILADPATLGSGGSFIAGVGLENITLDMDNVPLVAVAPIELRSVSNSGPFSNITVLNYDHTYLYVGVSANAAAQISDGLTFYDLYTLSKSADPANTDPGVLIQGANEVTFLGGRTKIQRRSSGAFTAGSIGIDVDDNGHPNNAITFNGISVAGFGTGIASTVSGSPGQGNRWGRVVNCTFETVNTNIKLTGSAGFKSQNWWTSGNRTVSNFGASPTKVLLDYAAANTIIEDELEWNGGKLVTLTANAGGNTVWASPANVSDLGSNNLVFGRDTTNKFVVGTGDQTAPAVIVNAAGGGGSSFPAFRLQRGGVEKFSMVVSSAFSTDEVLLSTGSAITRYTQAGSWIFPGSISANTLNVGGGTTITKHLSATAVLDFANITAAPNCAADLTIAVTGAAVGDTVSLGVPAGSVTANTEFMAWVSAADTVSVRACSFSGTQNPASGTFRVDVWKH